MNEWISLQSHVFSLSVYLAGHTYKKTNTYFDDEDRPIMDEDLTRRCVTHPLAAAPS